MMTAWKERLRFDKRLYLNPKWIEFYNNGMVLVAYEGYKADGSKLVSGDGATYLICQAFKWIREHIKGKRILRYELDYPSGLWLLVETENERIYMLYITQKDFPIEEVKNFLKEVVPC